MMERCKLWTDIVERTRELVTLKKTVLRAVNVLEELHSRRIF